MLMERLKIKHGYKKLMILSSDNTGCSGFRCYYPYLALKQSFINEPFFSEGFPKGHPYFEEADVIMVQRAAHESFPELFSQYRSQGKKIIYDLDDTLWHIPASNLAHRHYGSKQLKAVENVVNACDCITVSTIPLKEFMESKFPTKKVFLLPNHIWYNELNEKPKNDKIKIGWAGSYCYSEDTEILTEFGWKYFKDLDKTEKVAALNPTTNKIEYHLPSEYVDEEYNGVMYEGLNKDFDFCVTPNHNMYVSYNGNNYTFFTMEDIYEKYYMGCFLMKLDVNDEKFINRSDIKKIEYSGRIYCVTVPSHIIIVRRNNKQMICGNTHAGDFDHYLVDVIRKLPKDKIEFHTVGYNPQFFKKIANHTSWLNFKDYHQSLYNMNWDIGIIVAENNMFNTTKSAIKYYEYSAMKCATVAANTYPYINTIEHGIDGFIVSNKKTDWKDYIYALIEDEKFRIEMANKAYDKVKYNYTWEHQKEQIEDRYLEIFDYLFEGK